MSRLGQVVRRLTRGWSMDTVFILCTVEDLVFTLSKYLHGLRHSFHTVEDSIYTVEAFTQSET